MNENEIHGAPKKGWEWRIALSNHYAWLQTRGWDMANHGFICVKPIAISVSGSANVFRNEPMEHQFSFLLWWLICLEFWWILCSIFCGNNNACNTQIKNPTCAGSFYSCSLWEYDKWNRYEAWRYCHSFKWKDYRGEDLIYFLFVNFAR